MQKEILEPAVVKVMEGQGAQQILPAAGEEWTVWKVKGQLKLRQVVKSATIPMGAAQGEGQLESGPA